MLNLFGSKVNKLNNGLSGNVHGQLVKLLGDFRMPEGLNEANFMHTSKPILIPATRYPLELKDSSILQNDSLMRIYKRDANGIFENKGLYKCDKVLLQHKPYNYYTALLKEYFTPDYDRLKYKYFVLPKE